MLLSVSFALNLGDIVVPGTKAEETFAEVSDSIHWVVFKNQFHRERIVEVHPVCELLLL